ncbi:isoprenylcysteine carboxylmethyltransferase family protein [Vibrio sp. 99-8-1]|uniref:methyltransferase family protein n=1 Tax=Vibrio sp. 99-8-1 TaxID=2607602 RepID=UPI001493CCCA|nr:isoprenylcysteine carboxylmethyltransferase family protein [Vibrio sp. 99-8-1]NOI68087.1 isoprenylcysteine carboxylmethyltransferase family protein [Vibrio sp. 99-8-1]
MQPLELKVPPVLVFILAGGLSYLLAMIDLFSIGFPLTWLVFAACFVASGYFGLSGIAEFKKAKTTVHPVDVHKTSTVVESGVYKRTRNPMYLGLLLLLIGYGYWQQNLLCLLVPVFFVLYMNRFQIEPEERHLQLKFGQEYGEYKARVRRWI